MIVVEGHEYHSKERKDLPIDGVEMVFDSVRDMNKNWEKRERLCGICVFGSLPASTELRMLRTGGAKAVKGGNDAAYISES